MLRRVISAFLVFAVVAACASAAAVNARWTATDEFLSAGGELLGLGLAPRTEGQTSRLFQSRSVQLFATSPWILPLVAITPPTLNTTRNWASRATPPRLSSCLVTARSIRGPPKNDVTSPKS